MTARQRADDARAGPENRPAASGGSVAPIWVLNVVLAVAAGLHVHMGHGLNYTNVQDVAAIAGVEELNIGHSILSRALLTGIEEAVREMKARMNP